MNILRLVKREIAHSKFGFITGVLSLAAATAGLVGFLTLLRGHDAVTGEILLETEKQLRSEMVRMEDYYRRIMRDMGYNVLIINSEQDLSELRILGHPTTYLDYEDVWKLAHADITTLNHLLPVLQESVHWEEKDMSVMLSGIRGQVPVFSKPEFLTDEGEYRSPITRRVPEGRAELGHAVAARTGLGPGDPITVLGEEFVVNRVLPARGTGEDITIRVPLDRAQMILGREGMINGIFALECVCDLDELGMIQAEVSSVLPHARVFEFTSLISARAGVRQRAEAARREVARSVTAHRESLRSEKERFASVAIPLLVAGAGAWIFLLIFNNMRDRRGEIGILRAVGFLRGDILKIFLMKAMVMGAAGGIAGCAAGIGLGMLWSGAGLSETLSAAIVASGLLFAPVLSLTAGFIPSVLAASQDPAVILREE